MRAAAWGSWEPWGPWGGPKLQDRKPSKHVLGPSTFGSFRTYKQCREPAGMGFGYIMLSLLSFSVFRVKAVPAWKKKYRGMQRLVQ